MKKNSLKLKTHRILHAKSSALPIQREEYIWGWACSVAQSCLILGVPMDCSLPASSVVGISQTRILEEGSHSLIQGIFLTQGSNPRPASPTLGGGFFTTKPPGKPHTNRREGNLNKIFKQVEKHETFFKALFKFLWLYAECLHLSSWFVLPIGGKVFFIEFLENCSQKVILCSKGMIQEIISRTDPLTIN